MIISYCLNPNCTQPKNHPKLKQCYTCGANLILNNRYRAIKVLGKGGFGATFIGVDLTLTDSPLCVIKQLRPNADDPQALKTAINLFKREAKILGQINHPQIPKLFDYFEDQEQFYLIQELVNGQNLQREIKYEGVYGELALRRFLLEMMPVLKYIHSQKIIHRDIKPANILRRKKDNQLILIDFGAVKDEVNTQLAKTFGQTALTKLSVGTMGYAPPEQLAMRPIYSSDIYALGATSLYLLTGKSPKNFPIDSDNGELLWQQEVSLSDKMIKVLEKMLAINTRERFKSADEVITALGGESLEGNMMHTPPPQSSVGVNLSSFPDTEMTFGEVSKTMSPAQQLRQAIQKRKKSSSPKKMTLEWNEERFFNAHNNGKKDFSYQDLKNLNLEGGKLIKCVFRYSQLQGTNFKETSLSQANFYEADLSNTNFVNANLFQAYFTKSNLENADFTGANLGSADFTNANVNNANFSGANLKNAKINQQQLKLAKVNRSTILPDGSRLWWKIF